LLKTYRAASWSQGWLEALPDHLVLDLDVAIALPLHQDACVTEERAAVGMGVELADERLGRRQPQDTVDWGAIRLAKVSPGWMVVLCEGRRERGFYICGQCGAGFRTRRRSHDTPFGRECRGTLEQAALGHEFITDVLRLEFCIPHDRGDTALGFAYSLAYALVEGTAQALDVPSTDIGATVSYGPASGVPPIILYDNVPGGAGLVARLESKDMLRQTIASGLERVAKCSCGENTSCYGCLRNYRNQFMHRHLQRGPVAQYLRALLPRLS